MSGPIVRKYGFPNFDKIFGERDLQHGVDETDEPADTAAPAEETGAPAASATPKKKASPKKKKS